MIIIIKNYLLNTDVLLYDPMALLAFEQHCISISTETIRELSKKAQGQGEVASHAKEALKLINEYTPHYDVLTQHSVNKLSDEECCMPNGGTILIINPDRDRHYLNESDTKNYPYWVNYCRTSDTILVTNDTSTQLMAKAYDCYYEEYKHTRVAPVMEQYQGRREAYMSQSDIDTLYREKQLLLNDLKFEFENNVQAQLSENEFLLIRGLENPQHTALAIYQKGIIHLLPNNLQTFGIKPENVGQKFALYALLAPVDEIPLVILKGPAGTAKTFLSLAAALQRTVEDYKFDRILISRPNVKFDEDIGFLKGDEENKIGPLMRPAMDNLEQLCRFRRGKGKGNNYLETIMEEGLISMQAMAYMRGRSIANSYIILDEFQNATPNQALGIISRTGINSKIIIAGDIEQIDNKALDTQNNGLSFASEHMKNSPLCAQVTFTENECVRSKLALEAILRMSR